MSDETLATDRPATFRDVFESREFRFVFSSTTLSIFGDNLARAAITAMVFVQTGSVALSAAAFALSFLPWVVGGPFLATIAERLPFRRVMVVCDLVQMTLIAIIALADLPVWAMLVLLFAASLANPPFQAARSALLPQLLEGDRYVVGLSLHQSTRQVAQVAGYAVGAALAPFYPELALLLNSGTFALSALLIRFGVGDRRPIGAPVHNHLGRDTADGFRMVFGSPVLRTIAVLVFASMLFAVVPEGLAAAWAADLSRTASDRGWIQGMIMVANPIGFILGGLLVGRLVRPETRRRLIRPFAVLAPLALVPSLIAPESVFAIAVMASICGFAVAGLMPPANGLFVQALPASYRARAYGVMQGGVQVTQGFAVLVTGALADRFTIPKVVGWWSVAGVVLVLIAVSRWPAKETIAAAIDTAQHANGSGTAVLPAPDRDVPPTQGGPAPGAEPPDGAEPPSPRGPADARSPRHLADAPTPPGGIRPVPPGRHRRGLLKMRPGTAGPEHSEAGV